MASKWLAEESRELRELVFKGFSAAEIGTMLRHTRNAIIGRAHRMGLKLASRPENAPRQKPKSGRRKQTAPVAVAPVTPVPSRRPVEQSKEARAATTPRWSAPPPYPGRSVAASYAVIALKTDDCRWPINHVGQDSFRFCCAPRISETKPYCEEHTARAGKGW